MNQDKYILKLLKKGYSPVLIASLTNKTEKYVSELQSKTKTHGNLVSVDRHGNIGIIEQDKDYKTLQGIKNRLNDNYKQLGLTLKIVKLC